MSRLAEAWQAFQQEVLHPKAPHTQRQEMRRAFYAGAWAAVCQVHQLNTDDVADPVVLRVLEEMAVEAAAFKARVLGGGA